MDVVDKVIEPSIESLEQKRDEILAVLKIAEQKREKLAQLISEKRGAIGVLRALVSSIPQQFPQQPQQFPQQAQQFPQQPQQFPQQPQQFPQQPQQFSQQAQQFQQPQQFPQQAQAVPESQAPDSIPRSSKKFYEMFS